MDMRACPSYKAGFDACDPLASVLEWSNRGPAARVLRRRCRSEGVDRSPFEDTLSALSGDGNINSHAPGYPNSKIITNSVDDYLIRINHPHYPRVETGRHGDYTMPLEHVWSLSGPKLPSHIMSPNRLRPLLIPNSAEDKYLPKVDELLEKNDHEMTEVSVKQPLKSIHNNPLPKTPPHGILKKPKQKVYNDTKNVQEGRRRQRAISESDNLFCGINVNNTITSYDSRFGNYVKRIKDNSGASYSYGTALTITNPGAKSSSFQKSVKHVNSYGNRDTTTRQFETSVITKFETPQLSKYETPLVSQKEAHVMPKNEHSAKPQSNTPVVLHVLRTTAINNVAESVPVTESQPQPPAAAPGQPTQQTSVHKRTLIPHKRNHSPQPKRNLSPSTQRTPSPGRKARSRRSGSSESNACSKRTASPETKVPLKRGAVPESVSSIAKQTSSVKKGVPKTSKPMSPKSPRKAMSAVVTNGVIPKRDPSPNKYAAKNAVLENQNQNKMETEQVEQEIKPVAKLKPGTPSNITLPFKILSETSPVVVNGSPTTAVNAAARPRTPQPEVQASQPVRESSRPPTPPPSSAPAAQAPVPESSPAPVAKSPPTSAAPTPKTAPTPSQATVPQSSPQPAQAHLPQLPQVHTPHPAQPLLSAAKTTKHEEENIDKSAAKVNISTKPNGSTGSSTKPSVLKAESTIMLPDSIRACLRISLFPRVPPYLKFIGHDDLVPIKMHPAIQKHLKWKLTTITPIVVRKTLLNSGFKLVRSDCETSECPQEETIDWIGIWGKHMKSTMFRAIKDGQKMNHFPGTFQIGRKDRLWRNLQKLVSKFGLKEFGIMPKTYVLPHDMKLLKRDWEKYAENNERWIIKPPASARGTGIKVVSRWTQIPKKKAVVVQKYVSKPLLINGNKFDMRLYVLVTSVHPLRIYLYKDGLARFASVKYNDEVESLNDRYMHLTNYSINKLSKNYTPNEDFAACEGHKWTLQTLFSYLETEKRVNTKMLWETLKDLVIKTIIAGEGSISSLTKANITSRYNCYELFGVDVLLDEEMKPWLLEVNISPSLHSASPLDLHVKGPLVTTTLNIAQFQIPVKTNLDMIVREKPHRLNGLPYDSRLYTVYLSKEERDKHIIYTNMEERNVYLRDILSTLTPDDVRHLIQAEDELTQAVDMERVFPTEDTHKYLNYLTGPRYYNRLFDAWETRYAKNRLPGIELLRDLCVIGYHLEVPPVPLKNDVDAPSPPASERAASSNTSLEPRSSSTSMRVARAICGDSISQAVVSTTTLEPRA